MAKEIICKELGRECEPYEGEWADEPIAVGRNKATASAGGAGWNSMLSQLSGQIEKAQKNSEPDEIVAVMKEVRKILLKMQKQDGEAYAY